MASQNLLSLLSALIKTSKNLSPCYDMPHMHARGIRIED